MLKLLFCVLSFPQLRFETIDAEELSGEVTKYSKIVNQLEKGLQVNSVVAKLKDNVDQMRQKVLG